MLNSVLLQLKKLESIGRISNDTPFYYSYRSNSWLGLKRRDDNIFFPASIAFILKRSMYLFDQDEQPVAERIIERIISGYSEYRNSQRISYNFWKRKDNSWFPNGLLMHRFKHFALPDDVDTTAMILLTNKSGKEEVEILHNILPNYSNGFKQWLKNGHKPFHRLNTYSTWFGDRMPIETDVCVLCNLLYLILENNIDLNQHDQAVIDMVGQIIDQRLYYHRPFAISPEYPKPEVIIYHISRLTGKFPGIINERLRSRLIEDINKCDTWNNGMSRMLMELSLLYLNAFNGTPETTQMPDLKKGDWWFTAGLLSVYNNRMLQLLAPGGLFHFRFYCNAYIFTLFIEHQLLLRKKEKSYSNNPSSLISNNIED